MISGRVGFILMMASCDVASPDVALEDRLSLWIPGYLPADLFGNLPFYLVLSGCIVFWLCVGLLCALCADQIIALQIWITCVLSMGMIETTGLYAHYDH